MLAKSNSIIKVYMSILLVGLTSFDKELDLDLIWSVANEGRIK